MTADQVLKIRYKLLSLNLQIPAQAWIEGQNKFVWWWGKVQNYGWADNHVRNLGSSSPPIPKKAGSRKVHYAPRMWNPKRWVVDRPRPQFFLYKLPDRYWWVGPLKWSKIMGK